MADHFALMTGRLLTEATLRSAIIHEADDAVPSTTAAGYDDYQQQPDQISDDGAGTGKKARSGVVVECRICREEGDEAYMETPCSCKGSLKYAHHVCVQRWCNEKGDTNCEICLQKFKPNFTAPLKLFRLVRDPNSRGVGERPENRRSSYAQTADHQADGTSSYDSQNSTPKAVTYCRVVTIALMGLLVLRDAASLILGSNRACSAELITLLMLRTAGIVVPVYTILITATALLHRCNQQQIHRTQHVHVTPPVSSEPGGGAGGLQATPHQQHQHIINIR